MKVSPKHYISHGSRQNRHRKVSSVLRRQGKVLRIEKKPDNYIFVAYISYKKYSTEVTIGTLNERIKIAL